MEFAIRRICMGVVAAVSFTWGTASAVPIQFQINGSYDCLEEGYGCEAFLGDTGGDEQQNAVFTARITINSGQLTTVTGPINEYDDQPGLNYLVDGNVKIRVGDLDLQFSQYYLRISSDLVEAPGSILGFWGASGSHGFFFTMSDRTAAHFSQFSLDELAATPMTNFRDDSFNPASVAVWLGDEGRYSATGNDQLPFSIRRVSVPEPASLLLFANAAIALLVLRRRPTVVIRAKR